MGSRFLTALIRWWGDWTGKLQSVSEIRINQLAVDPFNPRISNELEIFEDQRYSKVGDWRIIYQVRETDQTILVITVQHRSRVYKELQK